MEDSERDLFREVCRETAVLVPCDRIDLALPSEDGEGFAVTEVYPAHGDPTAWEVPRMGSFAALVLERRATARLTEFKTAARHPEEKALRAQGFRAAAFVPLLVGGDAIGVLILCGAKSSFIDDAGVRLLERARGLIALATAATLARRPGMAAPPGDELMAYSDVSDRITREEDLNVVCRIFLDAVREQSCFDRAVLTLVDEQGKDVQWFFTGLTDAEIDHFHRNRMTQEEIRSALREPHRVGNSFRPAAGSLPKRGGLPPRAGARGGDGAEPGPLIIPLHGAGGVLLGTLMLDASADAAAPPVGRLAGLELFTCQIAHVLEKRRLDRAVKRSQARLRATQEQLMQADKLSAIGQLISGVAHELNNPLSGIMGFAQLMEAGENNPRAKKNLERIQNEAVRCQKIVQNLLLFSRRHKPEKTYRSLHDVIDGVLELRSYQLQVDDVRVERHYGPDLPMTKLDFHQMQQVVLNVVNNAHQAMMAVGDRERVLRITTEQAGERLRARFSDSGTGIPKDRLSRVFEPFYTTKESGKGTGLGLSLSLGIVKDHQGTMSVESVVGEGTTITIELPLIEGRLESAVKAETEGVAGGSRPLRILVVDDEAVLTDLLTDFLRGEGHQVDQARDGRVALRLASSNDYDVVLSDLKMPGLDGQGLYEQLCREKPGMKQRFVFSTGDLANPRVQSFFQVTGCRYFTKPFRLEAVLSVLNQVAWAGKAA